MLKIYNVAKKAETLALTDANELYANGLDTIKKRTEKTKRKQNSCRRVRVKVSQMMAWRNYRGGLGIYHLESWIPRSLDQPARASSSRFSCTIKKLKRNSIVCQTETYL